jgi:site-specific DNA-methyltransferase (adenine-specific)
MSRQIDKIVSGYADLRETIAVQLGREGVVIFPPLDISVSSRLLRSLGFHAQCCILDPWYNKGIGGTRDDYEHYILTLLRELSRIADHVFLWGFPEIVARFVPAFPDGLELRCWLTWFYKNSPSRVRGWRSAQMACLHLSSPKATMHVENFLNDVQKEKLAQGKLLYIPGPPSVIEEPLLCGFVGRNEQTGHPSQKPLAVMEKLILMATARGELVIDLMSGSGTAGEACLTNERYAILCDISEEYTRIAEERLGATRIHIADEILDSIQSADTCLPKERIELPDPQPRLRVRVNRGKRKQLGLPLE